MNAAARTLLLALVVWAGGAQVADAGVKLCNDGSKTLLVSRLYQAGLMVLGNKWKADGWYRIKGGKCWNVLGGKGMVTHLYLSVRQERGRRQFFIPSYAKRDIPRGDDSGSSGVDRRYCVYPSDAFKRTEKGLKPHQSCPKGYELEPFNLYVFTNAKVGVYTVSLGR